MGINAGSIGVLAFILCIIFFTQYHPAPPNPIPNYETIKIANWNMQIFGQSKANDVRLMNSYVDKIKLYDIIFLQEVRDDSGIAARSLCNMLLDYKCKLSSRAGTTSSKEQYLVIYRNDISISEFLDYNLLNYTSQFERPPIEVMFSFNYNKTADYINLTTESFNFTVWNIHIKPDAVKEELTNLESLVPYSPNTIILGDMNADCDYYKPENEAIFRGWNWLITDSMDTTVGTTNCAYDRILIDSEMYLRLSGSGIDTQVNKDQSDHYIVWAQLNKDKNIN